MVSDILLKENYEPVLRNGDFDFGESDEQHIRLLLETSQGEWRESPLTGVNLREWLAEDGGETTLRQTISKQLALDGATVEELIVKNGEVRIKAKWE